MKNSKTRLVILILIVAAVAGIIIYPNVVNKVEQDPQELSPAALLEEVMSHRQTTVLVFSYDAECCPGTQEFFAAYKEDVCHAMEPFSDKVQFVWINAGVENKAWQDEIAAIARQYSVTHLPSLLVINTAGETIELIVGSFDENQLHLILEGEVE